MILSGAEEKYWANLDVPIHNFIADEKRLNLPIRLYNKLRPAEASWLGLLNDCFSLNILDLKTAIKNLYSTNKHDFFCLFASVLFYDSVQFPRIVKDELQNNLPNHPPNKLDIAVYLLYRKNPQILEDIYYLNKIEDSELNVYFAQAPFSLATDVGIGKPEINQVLDAFEQKKKTHSKKRQSRAWWIKNTESQIVIAFRRLKKGFSKISFIDYNKYLQTAELKILIYNKNKTLFNLISTRELNRTLDVASHVAEYLTSQNVIYTEPRLIYPNNKINEYFLAILNNAVANISPIETKISNAPIQGSPTITLLSHEGVHICLNDLRNNYRLDVINGARISSIKLRYNERPYLLKLKSIDNTTSEINIIGKEKHTFLNEVATWMAK